MLSALIQQTYQSLTIPDAEKNKMTVSQVALLGLQKQYPCKQAPIQPKTPEQMPTWEVPH